MSNKQGKVWVILIIILVIIASCFLAGYLYIKSKFDKMTQKPLDESDLGIDVQEPEREEIKKINVDNIIKFVIFGSDSRDTENAYAGRSDTIIIVVINNVQKSINLISIPRDTYVNVPGYGMTKINHAYAYGQEQLSIKTINSNFGLDITQYMTIDFSGLVNSIDRVGGVEVTLDQDEVNFINARVSAENKIASAGIVNLNGTQALVHSRNRYVGNDFTRTSRQRAILISLLNKIAKKDVNEILSLSDDVLVNITTNMDMNKYKDMFLEVAGDRQEYLKNINSVQIPSTEYGYDSMIEGIYYFGFDMNRAKEDFNKYYYEI
ncbi:MAG: LCP family protein [Clostridia bacterium]